jgi:beta-mannosidase
MIRQSSGISRQSLEAGWRFRQAGKETWSVAEVPGCVHLDLLAHRMIDDPFHRDNVEKVRWIDEADWEYRLSFDADADVLARDHVSIVFDQLDTFATVSLNGTVIIEADNMFRPWTANVKGLLRRTENDLVVTFRSAVAAGRERMERLPFKLPAPNDAAGGMSPHVRKAPYHFGWDWGPCLVTCGISGPVRLEAWDALRITDMFVRQKKLDRQRAEVEVVLDIESGVAGEAMMEISWSGAPSRQFPVSIQQGFQQLRQTIQISNPQLWWPNGYGSANWYYVGAELHFAHEVFHQKRHIGLRTLEVVRRSDAWGQSFEFVVNGVPVFAKGANWIPADMFPTRIPKSKMRHMIYGAVANHMNMIRVWGGGIYECDEFYDLCDKCGILVWQDFMFACALYPGDAAFLDSVRQEAEYQVRRLRNHPSVALWCGNNENEAGLYHWGWREKMPREAHDHYKAVFDELLPDVCRRLDPDRLYWPSSPASDVKTTGAPQDPSRGDVHAWEVWGRGDPPEFYKTIHARFVSEFGFQSFPEMKTIAAFTAEEDRRLQSPVMALHQRAPGGNERIREYLERQYGVPEDFDRFVLLTQIQQAEAIRVGVEHFRRIRPRCMGSLYWQINDCWPVASWSSLDYYGRWKALHYYTRRFYSPVLVTVDESEQGLAVHIVSDKVEPVQARLTAQLMDFSGKVIAAWRRDVSIRPLMSDKHLVLGPGELPEDLDRSNAFLYCTLQRNGSMLSDTMHTFASPKSWKLKNPLIKVTPYSDETGSRIVLSSSAVARHVIVTAERLDGLFENNFFDLFPGEVKQVRLLSNQRISDADLAQHVRVLSLYDLMLNDQ